MIPVAEPSIGKEELKNVIEAIESGWISSRGKFIEEFENNFANYCNMEYGIATSNGTVAIHLALKALGIKEGDEVIVPNLTFIATANAVTYCNAKPIFVDSHPDYWCIDPEKIEEKITSRTKAIIPVHIYGNPCDMDPIMEIAEKYSLFVIEDAAESHGGKYKNKILGSFGIMSCYSFFANKVITTGEGGMVLTNDEKLHDKLRLLRDHGMNREKRYWYDIVGFNYRMTNLQGAVGVAQLTKIDKFLEKKRKIAGWYKAGLQNLAKKNLITIHPEPSWAEGIFWLYSILLNNKTEEERDDFLLILRENGIETRPFFYPINILPPYKYEDKTLSVSIDLASRGLNLPSSTNLEKKDIDFITDVINNIIK